MDRSFQLYSTARFTLYQFHFLLQNSTLVALYDKVCLIVLILHLAALKPTSVPRLDIKHEIYISFDVAFLFRFITLVVMMLLSLFLPGG